MSKKITLAIGPSCFTQCTGCYNHFAASVRRGETVTGRQVLDFAAKAKQLGVEVATLEGGDPLSHPDIVEIASGLKELGMEIHLDTVGSAFLGPADVIFFGKGTVPHIDMRSLLQHVDTLGVPIDGATEAVAQLFRTGRPGQVEDALTIIRRAHDVGVPRIDVNTVVHRGNYMFMGPLGEVLTDLPIAKWQMFQFQPTGPIGSANEHRLGTTPHMFHYASYRARQAVSGSQVRVQSKSAGDRDGAYFLVDDAGYAYVPYGKDKIVMGHIEHSADRVLAALEWHLDGTHELTIGQFLRRGGSIAGVGNLVTHAEVLA